MASWAGASGLETASVIADLENCFENIRRPRLLEEAGKAGFNKQLLRCLCVMYSGFRAGTLNAATQEPHRVEGTVLAGCSCAMAVVKLFLLRALQEIKGAYGLVRVKNLVDDITLQAVGSKERRAEQQDVLPKVGGAAGFRLKGSNVFPRELR